MLLNDICYYMLLVFVAQGVGPIGEEGDFAGDVGCRGGQLVLMSIVNKTKSE